MPKTVGIAVSNATFHFDKLYTYAVLPEHQNVVRLGSMVLVPFGKGSRARMGVVLACDAEPEHSKLKYLFDVAPASACLTPELLAQLLASEQGGRKRVGSRAFYAVLNQADTPQRQLLGKQTLCALQECYRVNSVLTQFEEGERA